MLIQGFVIKMPLIIKHFLNSKSKVFKTALTEKFDWRNARQNLYKIVIG